MITLASSLRINCVYKKVDLFVSECAATELEVKNACDRVTSVSGTITDVVDYEKIKTLVISASPNLEYFPAGIETFFPNLEEITITQTSLKSLTANNLKNFTGLKKLVLSENILESLNGKLFEFNKEIEEIDLSGNKITHIGDELFEFLPNLKEFDMGENQCFNQTDKNLSMDLKLKIIKNCSNQIDFLKSSGLFFAFLLFAILFVFILYSCLKFVIQ